MIERELLTPGTRFRANSAFADGEDADTIYVVVGVKSDSVEAQWIPAVLESKLKTFEDESTHLFTPDEVQEIVPWVVDEQMARFLDGVVGVVEVGDSFSSHMLWLEHHYKAEELGFTKYTWKSDNSGLLETVGFLDEMPVCISLHKAEVEGQLLLFVEPTSTVVDHRLIRLWYDRNLPKTAFRKDGYVNKTDAMNFSNVLRDR